MTRRASVATLASAMLATLSCSFATGAFVTGAPQLADVSAPPPAPALERMAPDPAVAPVRAELERRRTGLADEELDRLARTIVAECRRQQLDPALVMAVMHVESRFNNFAVSPVGARGLMQIMPATGEELAEKHGVRWVGSQTLFDPFTNVRLGVAYLKELSLRYDGSLPAALAAYNWGPGYIDQRLRRGRALPTEYPRLVHEARVAAQAEGRSS